MPRAGALVWPGMLAAAFCLAVLVTVPVIVLPPTLLIEQHGHSASAVGAVTSVISLLSVLGALVFAALPMVLERLDHADVGNGVVAQAGSLGSLLSPPLFGLVATGWGFPALVPLIAAGIVTAVGALLLVGRRTSRPRPSAG
ncbi:hypothetical protein PS9374_00630 [Planomonospora sphaerica]|uniref:MFS transporter n=1 Tax=Planomonospora sphaerica TaxID=161355 RepID=A0A171BF30_9ACTN|nr:hypothetical protein PS9374_00630 [Planomonospora sphaerica]